MLVGRCRTCRERRIGGRLHLKPCLRRNMVINSIPVIHSNVFVCEIKTTPYMQQSFPLPSLLNFNRCIKLNGISSVARINWVSYLISNFKHHSNPHLHALPFPFPFPLPLPPAAPPPALLSFSNPSLSAPNILSNASFLRANNITSSALTTFLPAWFANTSRSRAVLAICV